MKVGESIKETLDQITKPQKDHVMATINKVKEESTTTLKILGMIMMAIKTLSADGIRIQEIMKALQTKVERELSMVCEKNKSSNDQESVDELTPRLMSNTLTPSTRPNDKDRNRLEASSPSSSLLTTKDLASEYPILNADNYRAFRHVIEDVGVASEDFL